jgi:hypothetical protein
MQDNFKELMDPSSQVDRASQLHQSKQINDEASLKEFIQNLLIQGDQQKLIAGNQLI